MSACPRAQSRHALTAAYADVREPQAASVTEGNFSQSGRVTVSPTRCALLRPGPGRVRSADRPVRRSRGAARP